MTGPNLRQRGNQHVAATADDVKRSRCERAARRRSLAAATALALFITLMFLIGTGPAFLVGIGVTVAVHHWDTRVRPDPTPMPVIAYTLAIYLVSCFVIAITVAATAGLLVLLL